MDVGNRFATMLPMNSESKSIKKILVVDDDPTMRKALKLLLTSAKYDLTETQNGKQAMEKISCENFDLIITDLFLDGITGLEIFERFNEQIPVLIMTGFGGSPLARRARQQAGMAYIEKPFQPEALKEKIAFLLEKNE